MMWARRSKRGSRRRRSRPKTRSRTPSTLWPPKVNLAVNDLVDAIQAKLFTGPIFVKLWWFRFYIDPDSKIDALQLAAQHPPKGKRQIVKLIRELVDDDVIEFRPEVPLLAAFGGKVKVEQIEEAVEFVAHKLGLD